MPDPIANPFSAQSEMDVGDDVSERHRERQESIGNARTLDDLLNEFADFAGGTREKGDPEKHGSAFGFRFDCVARR